MPTFRAMMAAASSARKNIALVARFGCPPFVWTDRDGSDCALAVSETVDQVLGSADVRTVILTGFFESYYSRADMWGAPASAITTTIERRQAAFRAALRQFVDLARQRGKAVVIVQDNPEMIRAEAMRSELPSAARDFIFELARE